MNKKTLSKFIVNDYFELPPSSTKSKIVGFLNSFAQNHIELKSPALFVCNKTGTLDKFYIRSIIQSDFVFLSDSVIQKIYNDQLSNKELNDLENLFQELKQLSISIVVFPEQNYTFFGKCENLPNKITEILYRTNFDIKFLTIIDSYFNYPIWAPKPRPTQVGFSQQFSITHNKLSALSESERNSIINGYMPSSASIYSKRYPVFIRSNSVAENIETLIYACPKCKTFFSVYSEFNYLKCRECGSAIEFARDGQILLSNTISTFDDIDSFLYSTLVSKSFTNKPIITYSDIVLMAYSKKGKLKEDQKIELTIFADKIEIKTQESVTKIKIFDILNIQFLPENTIVIYLKDKEFILRGKSKENFYILYHLLKMNK